MRATLAALLLTLTTAASARPTLVIQPHAPTTTFNTTVEAVCRSRTCTTQNDTSVDHAALRGGEYEAVIVQVCFVCGDDVLCRPTAWQGAH